MKKNLSLLCLLLILQTLIAQNYAFQGTMSREVLENYLERSISMAAFESLNSSERAADI